LKLDATKLKSALADPAANLTALFNDAGKSTDSRVAFVGASSGVATGDYAFSVTRAATSGTLAGNASAGLTITGGVNDSLSISVDGVATSVTLAAGTYASADALAAELQSKLNGSSALRNVGLSVKVAQSAGVLTIASTSFGAGSSVASAAGNAAAGLLGAAPTATTGVDAAGTIKGSPATGSGQLLSTADGLRLSTSGATSGYSGTLTFTRGHASLLKAAMATLTDATNGPIAARLSGLNASVKSSQARQDAFNARMDALQTTYTRQFSSLNSMLTSMSQTQTYLSQMLTSNNSN
jgi:flagellar hook-associated protein 2